jgi:hypothetical protein
MKEVMKRKIDYRDDILWRLSKTYKEDSMTHQYVKKGLMKLTESEMSSLYAMVLTSTTLGEVVIKEKARKK